MCVYLKRFMKYVDPTLERLEIAFKKHQFLAKSSSFWTLVQKEIFFPSGWNPEGIFKTLYKKHFVFFIFFCMPLGMQFLYLTIMRDITFIKKYDKIQIYNFSESVINVRQQQQHILLLIVKSLM